MEFSRPECRSGQPFPSTGIPFQPRDGTRSPTLLEGSLPAEPPGKPKNTGVCSGDFPSGTSGKEPACQCRTRKRRGFNPWVRKEKGMATNSSILAWKIPWTEEPEPGRLQSIGLQSKAETLRVVLERRLLPGTQRGTAKLREPGMAMESSGQARRSLT